MIQEKLFPDGLHLKYTHIENTRYFHAPVIYIGGAFQKIKDIQRGALGEIAEHRSVFVFEVSDYPQDDSAKNINFQLTSQRMIDILLNHNISEAHCICSSFGGFYSYYLDRDTRIKTKSIALVGYGPISQSGLKKVEEGDTALKLGKIEDWSEKMMSALLNYEEQDNIENFKFISKLLKLGLKGLDESDHKKHMMNSNSVKNIEVSSIKFPSCPVLMLTGEYDSFTPIDNIKSILGLFENAVIESIPNADHFCHMQQKVKVANAIVKHFNQWEVTQ